MSMSNHPQDEQKEQELRELAESIWTPKELEEVRRKWEELNFAMEFSSPADRKEALRRYLDDDLKSAMTKPFITGVPGDFPDEVVAATKEDIDKLIQMLPAKTAEGVRQVAAERKAVAKKAQSAKALTKEGILKKLKDEHTAPGVSKHSIVTQVSWVKKWFHFVEGEGKLSIEQWEDRGLINQYLRYLTDQGYKPKTISNLYGAVQMLFKMLDLRWPMPKKAAPKVEWRDLSKPTLELEQVAKMIQVAKDKGSKLTNEEVAYLALSTIYAMRAIELARVADEDINYEEGIIYIKTAKGGEKRDQLLAPEIVPYLKRHKFGKSYVETYGEGNSRLKMRQIYLSIEKKAGIGHVDGYGWHSIRRAVENVLVPWNKTVAHIFTRWSSTGDIALDYVTERFKFDQEVFDGPHPFLPMWRGVSSP